jgi:hypothetical protein
MAWPQATDYNAAVQAPALCFGDPDLRQGQVAGDLFGLPRPHAGNFADVYQVQGADGAAWAVKCFTRPVENLRQRYQAISDHLRQEPRPFMVEFVYLEEGIRVCGQWYPVLKMKWVEGLRLNEFVAQHLDKPAVLERLAQMWVRLSQELRAARMGHGDLQHGNVLLVPGSKASLLALKLIDYDGMFVPALAEQPSSELGHPNYQHPQRLAGGQYGAEVDRFAHLVVYTALRCLCAGGAALWERHDSGENLLFREDDFRNPANSQLWPDLGALEDAEARALAGHLLLASQGPALAVPTLDELIGPFGLRPLSASEEAQLHTLLPARQPLPDAARISADPIPPLRTPLAGSDRAAAKPEAATVPAAEVLPDLASDTTPAAAAATAVALAPPPLPPVPPLPAGRRSSPDLFLPDTAATGPDPPSATVAYLPEPPSLRAQVAVFLQSSRVRLALAASSALGLLLLFGIVWALRPAPPRPPPEPPAPEPPRLHAPAPLTLRSGEERDLELVVERNGFDGPLALAVSGLPKGVRHDAKPALAAGEDRVRLHLAAARDAEAPPHPVAVALLAAGRKVDEQVLNLEVLKLVLPALGEPMPVILHSGESQILTAPVDRRGFTGRLKLTVKRLPDGVSLSETSPPAGEDTVAVGLRAAAAARPAAGFVRLELWAGDILADERPLALSVEPARAVRMPQLVLRGALAVEPGKNSRLRVGLDRQGYCGPVELALRDLPEGVTCEPASIDGEDTEGEVEVRVGADVVPGEYAAHLLARVKDETVQDIPLTVRVVKPAAVAAPPMPKPRPGLAPPQAVQFVAADQVTLHGLLYPGAKRKEGACVLLVHDLGQPHRGGELAGLAQGLQAAGHTVLQFDLRGHGDSREMAPGFWKVPVNRSLPGYRAMNAGGRAPSTIDVRGFPPEYSPWLIHDLAAARAFLDERHDDADSPVHAGNLVVVGVGEGATLSVLWLAAEFRRHAARPGFGGGIPELEKEPEIKRVRGAVWLSMAATLGRREMSSLPEWLKDAGRYGEVPMTFLFGMDDSAGAARSRAFAKRLEDNPGRRPPTVAQAIPGTALAATDLLHPDLDTEKTIVACVEAALQGRETKWAARGFAVGESFWHFPDTAPLPARLRGPRGLQLIPLDRLNIRFPGVKVP